MGARAPPKRGPQRAGLQILSDNVVHAKMSEEKKMYERNQLDVRFCGTKDMVADLLTKLLNGPSHRRLCDMLFRSQLEGEY